MNKKKNSTPVIGGCDIPNSLIGSPNLTGSPPSDHLGRQIFWLLKLHPEINFQFQDQDLNTMDDATKQQLLADINLILGIQPLQTMSL